MGIDPFVWLRQDHKDGYDAVTAVLGIYVQILYDFLSELLIFSPVPGLASSLARVGIADNRHQRSAPFTFPQLAGHHSRGRI